MLPGLSMACSGAGHATSGRRGLVGAYGVEAVGQQDGHYAGGRWQLHGSGA